MLSSLRNHFGIPGVIAVIALVFAMLGGAYAASNDGGGKATASAKGKRGPKGPKGDPGPAGPAGPAGLQGPAGVNGKDGTNGTNGSNGAAGAKGATGATGPTGEEGEEGEEGATGPTGAPWPAGGTLPPGATETGAWAFNATSGDGSKIFAPISFPVPLASEFLAEEHVHFQNLPTEEAFEAACPGGNLGFLSPKANPGELCVYYNTFGEPDALFNATFTQIEPPSTVEAPGAGNAGAIIRFTFSGSPGETAHGFGNWAMTGCSESLPVGDPNKCP